MKEDLASYYANVRPSHDFLKERLRPLSRDDIYKRIKQKNPVSGLDSCFLPKTFRRRNRSLRRQRNSSPTSPKS